jgi:hypothetical protein
MVSLDNLLEEYGLEGIIGRKFKGDKDGSLMDFAPEVAKRLALVKDVNKRREVVDNLLAEMRMHQEAQAVLPFQMSLDKILKEQKLEDGSEDPDISDAIRDQLTGLDIPNPVRETPQAPSKSVTDILSLVGAVKELKEVLNG